MNNPLTTGAQFRLELMNPNPSSRMTKDGPKYFCKFELTKEAHEQFMTADLAGLIIAGVCKATAFQIADDQADEPSDSTGQLAKEPTGQNCRKAISLCKDKDFWKFLEAEYSAPNITSPHYAGIWLKKILCIKSRRELDNSDRPELGAALWDISVQFDGWNVKHNVSRS